MLKRLGILLALAGSLISHAYGQTFSGQNAAVAGCLNITASIFGGLGNNSVDNATALGNALTAITNAGGTGGCVYFPPGKYKFNSGVTYSHPAGVFNVELLGSGDDNTVLTWPSASGGLTFNYAGAGSSVHIRDVSLTTGTTAGGNAINLQLSASLSNPANTATTDIRRVTIRGDDGYVATDYWTNGVNIGNVSNVQIDSLAVMGATSANGTGINLIGLPGSSTYGVVYNIAKSNFNNLFVGINYGSFIQGVTISQSNFTSSSGPSTGINIPAGATGTLDQLAISDSQFNVATNAFAASTALNHLLLANNLAFLRASAIGFNLFNNIGFSIIGNYVSASSTTGTNGIVLGGTSQIGTVKGNVVTGAATGINISSASVANATIEGNTLLSNTTALSNASSAATSNFIANNPGYNPVGVSSGTYAPASTATYTAGASPETDYLTGGTVTAVKVPNNAGTTICTGTPCTIDLGPNETFSVTYTGAPTQTKSVH